MAQAKLLLALMAVLYGLFLQKQMLTQFYEKLQEELREAVERLVSDNGTVAPNAEIVLADLIRKSAPEVYAANRGAIGDGIVQCVSACRAGVADSLKTPNAQANFLARIERRVENG